MATGITDVRGPRPHADWLCLAAAPSFAIMAVLSGMSGGDMCASMRPMAPFTGMTAMYLLMSAFHLVPWLKLIARTRDAAGRQPAVPG